MTGLVAATHASVAWLAFLLLGVLALSASGAAGPASAPAQPAGGALDGQRLRVIVSTDIGGDDPDDFQSMVHYLVYADVFDTEGLISSPPGKGRAAHILEVIDAYEKDYANLRRHSDQYPKPDDLRAITRQGATHAAPKAGFSQATDGSRLIIERARAQDERPLYVLVWGSMTDVAQALHDAPEIKQKVRVYSIGSWNTRMDRAARDYVFNEHPDLWWIESDSTFRGMYTGGRHDGDLSNREFIARHVRGHGALGDLLVSKKADIKMGDTPSVLYLLRGDPEKPESAHWGGKYVRAGHPARPNYWNDGPTKGNAEATDIGRPSVSQWREAYLRDWQARMLRARGDAR